MNRQGGDGHKIILDKGKPETRFTEDLGRQASTLKLISVVSTVFEQRGEFAFVELRADILPAALKRALEGGRLRRAKPIKKTGALPELNILSSP